MIRNLFNLYKYENRVLMYNRRSNYGNIYINNEYILKASNIKNRNYKHEFNILNTLNHPSIISVKDSFYEGDKFYTVFPYYKKGDLLANLFENKKEYENEWTKVELALAIKKLIKPIASALLRDTDNVLNILILNEYLSFAYMVCCADDTCRFHFLYQSCSPVITNFQMALHKTG